MAGIDLTTAEAKLALWLAAEEKLTLGQSVSVDVDGNRQDLTRADLDAVGQRIAYWDRWCKRLSTTARRSGVVRQVAARG
jgi:hypothetical protein